MRKTYQVRVMTGQSVDEVEACLDSIGFSTERLASNGGIMVILATGDTDMVPSQVELHLREMGCVNVSVKDQYRPVSAEMDPSEVNVLPEPPGLGGHSPLEFDVERTNMAIDKIITSIARMPYGTGDADLDAQAMADPPRVEYEEYMNSLVDMVMNLSGEDESTVIDAVYDVAQRMHLAGKMPEMPEEGIVTAQDLIGWVGAARTLQLPGLVMQHLNGTEHEGMGHVARV
jgi:hypothetical protein